ncbi:hypothetical protein K438DRAFT_1823308 [Mycena galopus ATCC 62051]|nr:hypothetical protein K438DRAFT_1823308 [Mycena galopus ATCC 62051]
MAVYYDEYGEWHSAYTQHDFYDDLDPCYDHPACEAVAAEYCEFYDETPYEDVPYVSHHYDTRSSDGADFEEVHETPYEHALYASQHCDTRVSDGVNYEDREPVNGGCMEIEYGQPGYWEEYHRRRYEIIYGSEAGEEEEEILEASDGVGDLRPDPPAMYEGSVSLGQDDAAEVADSEEGESVHAWNEVWERGPLPGENELAWAEAMEAWRQRIEVNGDSGDESSADSFIPYVPESDTEFIHTSTEELRDIVSPLPTLEELQASYDRGEIPEEDHEEGVRLLGELWACELEDQRLSAAGYVWNEELGEYIHPAEPAEYDTDKEDFVAAYLVTHAVCEVQHLAELTPPVPIPVIPHRLVPARVFPRRSFPLSSRRPFSLSKPKFTKRPFFARMQTPPLRRPFIPKARPPPAKTRKRHHVPPHASRSMPRDPPPHMDTNTKTSPLAAVFSAENAAAMAPAPSATPPPVVDDSRCSLGTVPIVAVEVLVPKEPVPPDIPSTPSATSLPSSKDSPVDTVLIPKEPGPPNIHATTISMSAVPARTTVPNSVVPTPVPKPPNIPPVALPQLKDLSASAQRRRNAQRRIAKKGKS